MSFTARTSALSDEVMTNKIRTRIQHSGKFARYSDFLKNNSLRAQFTNQKFD